MEMTRKINLNVRETVERSVDGNYDFHFYVEELSAGDYMPTYVGMADEKYAFDEMNDEFFRFLSEKSSEEGIYIRLVFASCDSSNPEEAVFRLEHASECETFRTKDLDKVLEFEFADFGIKYKDGEITFGATVECGCGRTPYFAKFGSTRGNAEFLSLDNPLNQHVISIMERMIVMNE